MGKYAECAPSFICAFELFVVFKRELYTGNQMTDITFFFFSFANCVVCSLGDLALQSVVQKNETTKRGFKLPQWAVSTRVTPSSVSFPVWMWDSTRLLGGHFVSTAVWSDRAIRPPAASSPIACLACRRAAAVRWGRTDKQEWWSTNCARLAFLQHAKWVS